MIYNRWGEQLQLIAYCGEHCPSWAEVPFIVVKAKHPDNSESYYPMFALRADSGLNEITQIVGTLPEIKLEGAELKKMLKEVE